MEEKISLEKQQQKSERMITTPTRTHDICGSDAISGASDLDHC